MNYNFDLISDLCLESADDFDWSGQPTSLFCIVAGNVARDRSVLKQALAHLGRCYKAVFFIDGPLEHANYLDDLEWSYEALEMDLSNIDNVIYLQNHVVVADGVAIVGTNGWWSYDMDCSIDYDQTRQWVKERFKCNEEAIDTIQSLAITDYRYIDSSIEKLQKMPDVQQIVVVTSTVPGAQLVQHDSELSGRYEMNITGNSYMPNAKKSDTEHKIKTWCCGTYAGTIDQTIGTTHYVNNVRGANDSPYFKYAFYPKRVCG